MHKWSICARGHGARHKAQVQYQCKLEQDAATTCYSNQHHHQPVQDQHGCRWVAQCSNHCNLYRAHTISYKALQWIQATLYFRSPNCGQSLPRTWVCSCHVHSLGNKLTWSCGNQPTRLKAYQGLVVSTWCCPDGEYLIIL